MNLIILKDIEGFERMISNVISFLCYKGVYLGQRDLCNMKLSFAYTKGINFALSNLSNASFNNCDLSYSNFNGAKMHNCYLKDVQFEESLLSFDNEIKVFEISLDAEKMVIGDG